MNTRTNMNHVIFSYNGAKAPTFIFDPVGDSANVEFLDAEFDLRSWNEAEEHYEDGRLARLVGRSHLHTSCSGLSGDGWFSKAGLEACPWLVPVGIYRPETGEIFPVDPELAALGRLPEGVAVFLPRPGHERVDESYPAVILTADTIIFCHCRMVLHYVESIRLGYPVDGERVLVDGRFVPWDDIPRDEKRKPLLPPDNALRKEHVVVWFKDLFKKTRIRPEAFLGRYVGKYTFDTCYRGVEGIQNERVADRLIVLTRGHRALVTKRVGEWRLITGVEEGDPDELLRRAARRNGWRPLPDDVGGMTAFWRPRRRKGTDGWEAIGWMDAAPLWEKRVGRLLPAYPEEFREAAEEVFSADLKDRLDSRPEFEADGEGRCDLAAAAATLRRGIIKKVSVALQGSVSFLERKQAEVEYLRALPGSYHVFLPDHGEKGNRLAERLGCTTLVETLRSLFDLKEVLKGLPSRRSWNRSLERTVSDDVFDVLRNIDPGHVVASFPQFGDTAGAVFAYRGGGSKLTDTTLVVFQDSLDAGNCRPGTEAWVEEHFPGRNSITFGELKQFADNHYVRRVVEHLESLGQRSQRRLQVEKWRKRLGMHTA